jgi:hypothetical protein
MLLLAHNALQCPASGGYPLTIVATASACTGAGSDAHAASNRALLLRMLPRLDWAAVLSAAKDVGRAEGLPAVAPTGTADALEEPLLARLQALLFELEVTEGELRSPCGCHRYAIHDAIPNMVVDLAARAGSAASRKRDGAVGVAAAGTALAAAAAAAPVPLDSDGTPVHRLYRRREKVEVCVMQGEAEPGGAELQAEAARLAPAITHLAQARQCGRINDVECVGGFLLVYLQARHAKSWLCGPRNGQNAHRLAFDAAAGDAAKTPSKRTATAAAAAEGTAVSDSVGSRLAIEEVPGLSLSEYHRNKLMSGGRRQHPSKKQRAEAAAEVEAAAAAAVVAAQGDTSTAAPGKAGGAVPSTPVPVSVLELFAGWQLASVPNYASRALVSWAAQLDRVGKDVGGAGTDSAGRATLSFLRPSPASHLSVHAAGGRYVTLRLAADTNTTELATPAAGTSPDVALDVERALGSLVCGRDPFELILHELKLLDVAMGNSTKRHEWVGLCSAMNAPTGLGPRFGASYDAAWSWDWARIVGEMAVSQRPEHTLGYMKARLLAAFTRGREGAEPAADPAAGGMMQHEAAGGIRQYLTTEEQAAFNSDVWLGVLASLGLEGGTAAYVAGVRLGSEEYVPDADIPALRETFARQGAARGL